MEVGDTVEFKPKNGQEFPTGEKTRVGVVESIRGNEIVVRQKEDDFTKRISEDQIVG